MTNRLTQRNRPIRITQVGNRYKISVLYRNYYESTLTDNIEAVEVLKRYKFSEHYTVQQAYETLYKQIKTDNRLK
jgi:hypothetical protein